MKILCPICNDASLTPVLEPVKVKKYPCRTELDMSYLAEIEMSGLTVKFWAWKRSLA